MSSVEHAAVDTSVLDEFCGRAHRELGVEVTDPAKAEMGRFLRSRDNDLEAAFALYRQHVEWRTRMRVSELTPERMPTFFASGMSRVAGHDKAGHPILLMKAGRYQPRITTPDEYELYIIFWMRTMMERMPPGVDQFLVLFDFSEWGLRNYDKSATDRLVSVLQNHFPETLFKCFVMNTPLVFRIVWRIVKPWLDAHTVAKVEFPTGPLGDVLKEYIAEDVLEEQFGGTHAPYPAFDERLEAQLGREIEEQDPEALGKPAGTRAVQVPAGQAVEVGVACGAAGDTVEWSYSVEAHNINFTLLWRDLNPDGPSPVESDATALREVQAVQRKSADGGTFEAPTSGELVLRFDNTFSWRRGKTVTYTAVLVPAAKDSP